MNTQYKQIQKIHNYPAFCRLLHDRFYSAIRHNLGYQGKFTLFINTYEHDEETTKHSIYAGVVKGRQLLEGENKKQRNKDLDWAWNFLENKIETATGTKEGKQRQKLKVLVSLE
ncbi:MAG: hypothetical protein ACPG19_06055 [Saprospiraceae bacterium]